MYAIKLDFKFYSFGLAVASTTKVRPGGWIFLAAVA